MLWRVSKCKIKSFFSVHNSLFPISLHVTLSRVFFQTSPLSWKQQRLVCNYLGSKQKLRIKRRKRFAVGDGAKFRRTNQKYEIKLKSRVHTTDRQKKSYQRPITAVSGVGRGHPSVCDIVAEVTSTVGLTLSLRVSLCYSSAGGRIF